MSDAIYVLQKGEETVSLTDHKSLLDLSHALMVLGCTENMRQREIKGHKPADDIYKVGFLEVSIEVVGLADLEKVIHWVLAFGCNKITIEKMPVPNEEK